MLRNLQRWLICLLLLATATAASASGGFTTPLQVMAPSPITDEMGRLLDGSADSPGDAVQVIRAPDGVKYPPQYNGQPDARNEKIAGVKAAVGLGTLRSQTQPANFGIAVSKGRPADKEWVFVRVFNAPDPTHATFYGDSQLFKVSGNKTMIVELNQTAMPIDDRDFDGDGVINSWEDSLGLDKERDDTDADGMSDGDEFRAGTDPWDRTSRLAISRARRPDPDTDDLVLEWPSVPGKQYVVEFTEDALDKTVTWSDVSGVITADSSLTQYTVPNGIAKKQGKYRIRLVE